MPNENDHLAAKINAFQAIVVALISSGAAAVVALASTGYFKPEVNPAPDNKPIHTASITSVPNSGQQENRELVSKSEELSKENAELKATLQQTKKQLSQSQSSQNTWQRAQEKLNSQIDLLETQKSQLADQLQQQSHESIQLENSLQRINQKNQALLREKSELRIELNALQESFPDLSLYISTTEHQQQIANKDQRIEELHEQLSNQSTPWIATHREPLNQLNRNTFIARAKSNLLDPINAQINSETPYEIICEINGNKCLIFYFQNSGNRFEKFTIVSGPNSDSVVNTRNYIIAGW